MKPTAKERFQNSRGFRVLNVWVALKQGGKSGYARMIHHDIKLAKTLFNTVNRRQELEAVSHQRNIVNFRFIPLGYTVAHPTDYLNKLNEEILNRLQAGGEVFLSHSVIENKYCLRACIVNFKTTVDDIETLADLVIQTGRTIDTEMKLQYLRIKPYY